jgi:preprotein translocase subunit SecF
MQIIRHTRVFISVAAILVLSAVLLVLVWGLPLGIDFTGGSLLEVEYAAGPPDVPGVRRGFAELGLGEATVQPVGERGILLRLRDVDEETHQRILASLRSHGELEEKRFESIGPAVGRELARRSIQALLMVLLLIVLYIAWAFRKVSGRVSSWKYGIVAIVALAHDVAIPTGIVAALGRFGEFQVDAFFITALLTILGFSVHDTIVVFDRIRENLKHAHGGSFGEIAERSVNEVMGRSIKTSTAVLLVLASVLLFGGETTQNLALVLMLGIFFGTYSSIFVASPLLVLWETKARK